MKKVKEKDKHNQTIETYFVLKSDKKIKQGYYIKQNYDGKLIENGYYKNNKKDSLWVRFNYNGIDTLYVFDYTINDVIIYNLALIYNHIIPNCPLGIMGSNQTRKNQLFPKAS